MFVKRIELMGFKTFADRTVMEIAPGVTVVVGPNGSGKSNIADAIRFVLGEQSIKMLRGARLEDVIFAGSETRKPVNFAEIRLFIDNADGTLPVDFAEVAVARRVYRSGESEFLINQTPCRLKDINELFMDTGLGREAYSVIGQGRIEEILSNKPEDRRGIFEEAAGIIKFKARRREAEKKLTEADQSLLRVRDLISELAGQLEPLAKRSGVAKAYREILAQVEQVSGTVITAEFDSLFAKNQELQEKNAALGQALAVTIAQEVAADRELVNLRAQLENSEQAVEGVQAALLDATAKLEKHQGDQRVHQERKAYLLQHQAEVNAHFERLEQDISATEAELAQHEVRREELDKEIGRLRQELKRHQEERLGKANLQKLRGQLADSRVGLIELMRKQAAGRNELHNAEFQLTQYNRQSERLQEELAMVAQELGRLEHHLDLAALELQKVQELSQQHKQARAKADHELKSHQVKRTDSQQAVERREKMRLELASRLRAIQGMHEARQGFASGPKTVLAAAADKQLAGIFGAVADLVKVEKDYELAIETALGGSMQNLVTDTEASARKAISYLKQHKAGRATFLPIATLSNRRLADNDRVKAEKHPGWVGIAADLVKVDPQFQPVVEFLLGQVLVVKDLESANHVAAALHYRLRIVTLEGDVVHPGGSMSGGSLSRRGASMLAMNRDIEELKKELAKVELELADKKLELHACENKELELKQEWNRLDELCTRAELAQRDLESKGEIDRVACQKQAESVQAVQADLARLRLESKGMEAEIAEAQTGLMQVETEVAAAENLVRQLELQIAAEETRQEEHQDEWTEWRVKLAESEESLRGVTASCDRLRQALWQSRHERGKVLEEFSQLAQRADEFKQTEQLLGEAYQQLRARLSGVERDLEIAQENRSAIMQVVRGQDDIVQAHRSSRREQESVLHEQQLALSKNAVELENKENELQEKHGIGIELARTRYPLAGPLAAAKKKLLDLHQELMKYDGVNLGDIQEYERMSERHQFLAEQEADLELAQTQLRDLIVEMDEEMGKRFSETFAQVKASFQEVFRVLFGGGRADLRLEGSGDPLRDGIEILAEPPGKKLQNLALLSGGERALTALALLFAILKVRPVPFCVLDEVEAALDEVNVIRFSEFLKQFAAETQFTVITHRRGTMEVADVLYGVTMQESGVSKLVSVKVLEEPVIA